MNKKNVKLFCNIAGEVLKVVVPIILTSILKVTRKCSLIIEHFLFIIPIYTIINLLIIPILPFINLTLSHNP